MAIIEKHIFETLPDLQTYLESKNFTIANNQIRYTPAGTSTSCYWSINPTTQSINFHTSDNTDAFLYDLANFTSQTTPFCGVVYMDLLDNGCILYMTQIPSDFSIADLTFNCANNYRWDTSTQTWIPNGEILQNGLVVCTPAEEDGKWRYTWRDKDARYYKWNVDNTTSSVTSGIEIPSKILVPGSMSVTLTKAFLKSGYWSNYIYVQVLGDGVVPYAVFRVNGQKYIAFSDNANYRCPAFKLPPEYVTINDSSSTELYSPLKIYFVGDYCIYNNLLWRCINNIPIPGPFNQADWDLTTVTAEKQTQ